MWTTLASIVAQAAPGVEDWAGSIITGLGSAGVATGILWKVHQDHVKRAEAREQRLIEQLAEARGENGRLTNRLFLLADRGMEVGQTASEVVKNEANDPELLRQMQKLEALLEQRGAQ